MTNRCNINLGREDVAWAPLDCVCELVPGHTGPHRCQHGGLFMRARRIGEHATTNRTAAEVAAKQLRKLQWNLLEAALFSLSSAQYEYERNMDGEAGLVHMNDARRAVGALALSLADGPDAAGYAELFKAFLTPPRSVETEGE